MAWKKILLDGDAAVLSSTAPVDVTKAAASAGSATQASKQDHKHDITTATAGAIAAGDTAAEGTATTIARSDHKHSSPATWPATSHALSGHTAAAANLDVGGFAAVNLLLENAATAPGTTTVGRIYYNTADFHPYVYQA